jgi:hypothetical protein
MFGKVHVLSALTIDRSKFKKPGDSIKMCSDSPTAKEAITAQEIEGPITDEEAQRLAEFETQIRRSIKQFEAGLGRTFDDKEEFLNYLRNL